MVIKEFKMTMNGFDGGQDRQPVLSAEEIAVRVGETVSEETAVQNQRARKNRNAYRGSEDEKRLVPRKVLDRLLSSGEHGMKELLIRLGKGKFLFDHSEGSWFKFNGHCYSKDTIGDQYGLIDLTKAVLAGEKEYYRKLDRYGNQGTGRIVKKIYSALASLNKLPYAKRVIEYAAQGKGSLGISGAEWNRNASLIAFTNGVLDTESGEFRPGRPEDFIRIAVPHPWLGWETPAPEFEKFLASVLPEDPADPSKGGAVDVVSFLQRVIGHTMGGAVKEHILVILTGAGQNGKGTLLETIGYALGPLAGPVQSEMLMEQKFSRSSSAPSADLMSLRGKRLVWASESNDGVRIDSGKVKKLTGGDSITARPPYGKHDVVFPPTHQLLLLTNHVPEVDPDDNAMWYRLRLIPFPLSFVETPAASHERKKDSGLKARLEAEVSGILAWILRGYREYKAKGLAAPSRVMLATSKYRNVNDTLSQFIEECLERAKDSSIAAGSLYQAYVKWAENSKIKPLSLPKFGERIKSKIDCFRDEKGHKYRGYKLLKPTK